MRRFVSLTVAVTMMLPWFASAAEATVCTWLSPIPGQRIVNRDVEISVGYNTQSDQKVTKLELWVDGKFYSQKYLVIPESRGVCSFWWNASRYSGGSHSFVVKIYSGETMITKVSSTASVGNVSNGSFSSSSVPAVTFANIKSGDVLQGSKNIKIKVPEDAESNPLVTLKVDDSLKLLSNRPPYSYNLDTTSYEDGDHKLETFAYDTAGNKGDASVVKVVFKNGAKRPLVASMNVNSHASTEAHEDEISAVIPSDSGVASARESSMAARVSEADSKLAKSGQSANSVAEKPIAIVQVAPVINKTKVSSSPVSSDPERVVATSSAKVRVEPVKPIVVASAPKAAEPETISEPRQSDLKRIPMSSSASIRTERHINAVNISSAVVEEVTSDPVSSNPKNVVASRPIGELRNSHVDPFVSTGKPAEPAAAKSSLPKPVRMAKAPSVTGPLDAKSRNSANCPQELKKNVKAKLEKIVVPASGKVKLRDLLNQLGGWLFWDQDNQTVVAYFNNMAIEMKIGSNIVKVNGNAMHIDVAPSIENGRTVVDTTLYHKALALVEHGAFVETAKLD